MQYHSQTLPIALRNNYNLRCTTISERNPADEFKNSKLTKLKLTASDSLIEIFTVGVLWLVLIRIVVNVDYETAGLISGWMQHRAE